MSKMKSFVRALVCAAALATSGVTLAAKTPSDIFYVGTYGELIAHSAERGIFLVRDASGDPLIKGGWGLYNWDSTYRKWVLLSKEEVTTLEIPDLTAFLKKDVYYADITPFKRQVMTNTSEIVQLHLADGVINARIDAVTNDIGSVTGEINVLKGRATALEGRADALEARATALEEYDATNDVNIAALRQKDAEQDVVISNNLELAKQDASEKAAAVKTYVDGSVVPLLETKIQLSEQAANAYTDETKQDIMVNVGNRTRALRIRLETMITNKFEDAKLFATSEAMTHAALAKQEAIDVAGAFTTNKVAEALDAAKADATAKANAAQAAAEATAAANLSVVKTNLEEQITAGVADAKDHSDANLATAKAYTDEAVIGTNTILVTAIAAVNEKADNAQATANAVGADLTTFKSETNAKFIETKTSLTNDIRVAKEEAIASANTHADTVAGNAETAAKSYADGKVSELAAVVDTKASKQELIDATNEVAEAASIDAAAKASQAKTAAIASAKSYTDGATNKVLTAAKDYADKEIDRASDTLKEYADGKASAALTSAKSYTDVELEKAVTKIDGAIAKETERVRTNAVDIASQDATTKANAAKTAAISAAKTYTDTAVAEGVAEATHYADGVAKEKADAAEVAAVKSAKLYTNTAVADAKTDLTNKIDVASKATLASAKEYTNTEVGKAKTYADTKKEEAIAAAAQDATDKADAVQANVTALDAKVDTNYTTVTGRIETVNSTLTDKINVDVAAAKSEASTNLQSAKTELKSEIAVERGRIDTHDTKIATLEGKIAGVYHFKGTVANIAALPTDAENADVYYVTDVKESYAFLKPGEEAGEWKPIGKDFDLSAYKTWTDTQSYINTEDGKLDNKITALTTTVANNKTAAEQADAALSSDISTLDGKVDTAVGKLTTDVGTAQTTADNAAAAAATADGKAVAAMDFAVAASNNVLTAAAADATTKANAAETSAKTVALTTIQSVKTELTTEINKKDSIESVNGKITAVSNSLETIAQTKASAAETAAKGHADTKVADLKTYVDAQDVAVSNNVLKLAKEYTDSKDPGSKSYVQEQIAAVSNNVIKIAADDATDKAGTAKTDAIADAKSYTDGEISTLKEYVNTTSNNVLTAATGHSDANLELAKSDATTKANAAQVAAEATASNKLETAVGVINTELAKKDTIESVDAKISAVSNAVLTSAATTAQGYANTAESNANTATDTKITNLKSEYIDVQDAAVSNNVIAIAAADAQSKADTAAGTAKSDAIAAAKSYTDGATGEVARVVKKYTDDSISPVSAKVTQLETDIGVASNNVLTAAIKHSNDNFDAAKTYAENQAAAVKTDLTSAEGAIAVAKSQAIAAAAEDATTKAAAAEANAFDTMTNKVGAIDKATVKAEIDYEAAQAKSEAISAAQGSATDSKESITIYGARAFATDKASTAKSEAVAAAATDASTKTNELSKALIGTTSDTSSAKTYYGLKKYSDSTFRKISDSYTKTQVYTKTEVDNKLTAALVTASNTAEQVVADKVNAKAAEPKATAEEEVYNLKIKSNTVNTLLPKVNMTEGCELYVDCEGDRNFKLFLPAEQELLCGLPITVATELPAGVSAAFATRKTIYKLPAKIVCEQPYSKLAVFTVTELETDTDWTPVITNMCIVCTNTVDVGVSPKFVTVGSHALEGKNLHGATEFKVVYPTNLSTGATATNDFETAESGGVISGTFYNYTQSVNLVPTGMAVDGTTLKSWFKIIYKTVNGAAEVKQYNVQF